MKMTDVKVKPPIIEVNRFYRPKEYLYTEYGFDEEVVIASDRGVTVMFTVNYLERTFSARYSVCRGDNFCKATGIIYAQACPAPIEGAFDPEVSLYANLLDQCCNILNVPAELQDKKVRRDIERLYFELLESL
jgi:hypothetical protein